MESQVKETVYSLEELNAISEKEQGLEELQAILGERGIGFHHMNKENALIAKIMESNPHGGGEDVPQVPVVEKAPEPKVEANIDQTVSPDIGIVKLELLNAKRTGSLRIRDYTHNGEKKILRQKDGSPWVYMITKNEKLDLSRENDRNLYNHLLTHPVVIGGSGIVPCVTLKNENKDSLDIVENEELAMEAKNIIRSLGEKDLRSFARVIGVVAANKQTALVVKSKCYELCNEKPQHVLNMWADPRKDLRALVFEGMDKGVIAKVQNVFKYREMGIGTTADEVTLWFEKNSDFLPTLRKQIQ